MGIFYGLNDSVRNKTIRDYRRAVILKWISYENHPAWCVALDSNKGDVYKTCEDFSKARDSKSLLLELELPKNFEFS